MSNVAPTPEDLAVFQELIEKYRYDFCKLVYIIFPFGQPGHDLEFFKPYDWQMEEWQRMSDHFNNPLNRDIPFKLGISSGNGAAKTAFGAMTFYMLMFSQKVRGRITANTKPQMTSVIWPEYDIWFHRARYANFYFEKLGESIKARDPEVQETWRLDIATWNEANPSGISGLHNAGHCTLWVFEEAPGIPAVVYGYAAGAMSDANTMKVWLAFGNSDDPNSKFEQNMTSPDWYSRRIDTRTLSHVSKEHVAAILRECGGNEDHDEFRRLIRGLPRKAVKDSIMNPEAVEAAIAAGRGIDHKQFEMLPSLLTVDPAWDGGDETVIWHHQGAHSRMLDRYKLDKSKGDTHMITYNKLCRYEALLKVDAVWIDQGEGTALKTLASNAGKWHWLLVNFGAGANDALEFKDSEYHNMRAKMYYEAAKALMDGEIIISTAKEEDLVDIAKQLCFTRGGRHNTSLKKIAEPKKDIKIRIGFSPDLSDGFVLRFAHPLTDRLEENMPLEEVYGGVIEFTGGRAWTRPPDEPNYDIGYDVQY